MVPGFAKNQKHTVSILDTPYNNHLDKLASNNHYCSVGFSAIQTMLDLGCDVHMCGFDFYTPNKRYHYFEECSRIVQKAHLNHSIGQEKEYYLQLIKQNKIKLF